MDSNGESVEGIPGRKASLPSPEELETQYKDIVKKAVADRREEIEQQIGPIDDNLIEKILTAINYSDPENLSKRSPDPRQISNGQTQISSYHPWVRW